MLQEGDQGRAQTNDLVRRHIHVLHFIRLKNREVTCLTRFDLVFQEVALVIHWHVSLRDLCKILFFRTQEPEVLQIHFTFFYFMVRCFYKAHRVDLRMHAQRRYKTDVRSFRCFDSTQAAVVAIMYVTNLEACTLTAQTARA